MTAPTRLIKPGFYFDMPAATYFADPCPEPSFTQSIAKELIAQSELHARAAHPRFAAAAGADDDADEKYNKVQAIGNAAHAVMIGRGKTLAVGDFDSWRGKEAGAFKTEALAVGKTIILAKHHETALVMVKEGRDQLDTIAQNPDFRELRDAFRAGQGEVVLAWQEAGLWLRTMIDWLMPDKRIAYDFKTGGMSMAPHTIAFKIDDDGWDVQAAMHERGLNALDPAGAGRRRFRFVAQENYPPYALVPYELGEAHLTMGRKKLDFAWQRWRRAMKSGQWPGYPRGVIRTEPHPARENRWLEREQAEHDAALARPRNDRHADNLSAG